MSEALDDMRKSGDAIDKLLDLEIALLNVSCTLHRCLVGGSCFSRCLPPVALKHQTKVPVTPDESRILKSRGRAVAIQVLPLPALPHPPPPSPTLPHPPPTPCNLASAELVHIEAASLTPEA
jgi:hypothetical protein